MTKQKKPPQPMSTLPDGGATCSTNNSIPADIPSDLSADNAHPPSDLSADNAHPPSDLFPIVVLSAAVIGLALHAMAYNFICDDAYISFRYSYNLAHHNELTFNLGERVEGYTNFSWTVLLGLLLKLGFLPEVTAKVLGIFFGGCVLVLLYLLTRLYRGSSRTGWDFLGALLLPTWGSFAVWCSGGLETQLFTALCLGGVVLYIAEHAHRVQWRTSGVLFALAAMTRPEGLLFFGLTALHLYIKNLTQKRIFPEWKDVLWVLGFILPIGIYFFWRYQYYGYPFPNTYYVKSVSGIVMAKKWGLPYLWDFIHQNRFYALALLLIFFRPRPNLATSVSESPRGVHPGFIWSYVLLLVLSFVAYVTWMGGDFMAMGRFFVPILPFIAFFAQEGLRETIERFPKRLEPYRWRPLAMLLTTGLVLSLGIVNSVGLYRDNQKMSYYRWGLDTIAYLKTFADDRIKIGTWMREHLPKDTYYSVGGAGASCYASEMKALDVFGLTDNFIAHHGFTGSDRPGHGKYAPESYIMKQRPDLLCHTSVHQDFIYRPSAVDAAHWRSRGYEWVCLTPDDLRPSHYCCPKRIDRDLGPALVKCPVREN